MTAQPQDVAPLVEQIRPILAGHPPQLQGAVLADLLAIWLAGHQAEGDPENTRSLRAQLLTHHIRVVRQLTTVNATSLGTPRTVIAP